MASVGFLNLGTIYILDWIILCGGAVPSIVGCLATALVSSHWMPVVTPPIVTTKKVFRCCQMSSRGQNHPWLRATGLVATVLDSTVLEYA